MKLAYVYDNIHPYVAGGIETRIWEIATRLAGRGHEIHVFSMKYWDGPDVFAKDGVIVHGVCKARPLFSKNRRSIREAVYFAAKVFFPLCREKFDLIDVSNFPYFPAFSALFSCFTRKTKVIITWHEVWGDYWYHYLGWLGIFGIMVERLVLALGRQKLAVSEQTETDLRKLGVRASTKVIPNGVNLDAIDNAAPSSEKSDVIFAGRLIADKNVDLLIKAIEIARRDKPDMRCIILGDGPEKTNLEGLVKSLGLQGSIVFKGVLPEQQEVYSCMKSSKVLVLPSSREGFGIVAVEANACGIPVLTLQHARNAARYLIKNDVNGYTFEYSESDLARLILKSIARDDWASSCRKECELFNWSHIVESIEDYYERALGKPDSESKVRVQPS